MKTYPQDEHRWLEQLVGEWTYEADFSMAPDQPRQRSTGVERVRSVNGLWIISEAEGEMPGGDMATSIMTLGYDTVRQHYVGSFISSMMAYLWVYKGTMDSTATALTLEAEGPSFKKEGKMAKYRDIVSLKSGGGRLMTSFGLGDDGRWREFMTITYRRR